MYCYPFIISGGVFLDTPQAPTSSEDIELWLQHGPEIQNLLLDWMNPFLFRQILSTSRNLILEILNSWTEMTQFSSNAWSLF